MAVNSRSYLHWICPPPRRTNKPRPFHCPVFACTLYLNTRPVHRPVFADRTLQSCNDQPTAQSRRHAGTSTTTISRPRVRCRTSTTTIHAQWIRWQKDLNPLQSQPRPVESLPRPQIHCITQNPRPVFDLTGFSHSICPKCYKPDRMSEDIAQICNV